MEEPIGRKDAWTLEKGQHKKQETKFLTSEKSKRTSLSPKKEVRCRVAQHTRAFKGWTMLSREGETRSLPDAESAAIQPLRLTPQRLDRSQKPTKKEEEHCAVSIF